MTVIPQEHVDSPWRLLLFARQLRLAAQGVNHNQTLDRHFTREIREWIKGLGSDLQILAAEKEPTMTYWYYDADLARAHLQTRKKWPFQLELQWHLPANELRTRDTTGLIKNAEDVVFRFMGLNDAWVDKVVVGKDADNPSETFDVTVWAMNVPASVGGSRYACTTRQAR